MVKTPRRSSNGVSFLSGGSSVFSASETKPIGVVQFFSAKATIITKVKKAYVVIIQYEEYACTIHPHPNPRMLHEAIGVSIGMNGPPNVYCVLRLPSNPTTKYSKNIFNCIISNKRNNNDNREFSVSRRDF